MSLVPILYTSLLLFAVVMFVVVTVSYIAYKIKNRSASQEEQQINELAPQPSYLSSTRRISNNNPIQQSYNYSSPVDERVDNQSTTSIKVVPTIKNPELKRTSELPIISRRTEVLNSEELSKPLRTSRFETSDDELESNSIGLTQNSRTNPGSFKQRVEILNKVVPKESPKESFNIGGSGSIALPKYYRNFQAIHYYSDDEDESYYKPYRYME